VTSIGSKAPTRTEYRCTWSFVAEDKSEALATVVTMRAPEVPFFILKFRGLDPDKHLSLLLRRQSLFRLEPHERRTQSDPPDRKNIFKS